MKEIQLTKGQVALVDDEDYEELNKFKWFISCNKKGGILYAAKNIKGEHNKKIRMHSFIMECSNGDIVDHIDGNGLNNQKTNLRKVSRTQNNRNTRKIKKKSSQYKGVYWNNSRGCWQCKIMVNKKSIYIGKYSKEILAAFAYDVAAHNYFKEYASFNFPISNFV